MEKKLAHRNREVLALRKAKQFCTAEMSAIVERVEALFAVVGDEQLDALIAAEVTVLFAPKEWQSTGPQSRAELVAHAPPPKRLVVVLAPPLSRTSARRLRRVAGGAWPNAATEVQVVDAPACARSKHAF